MDSIHHRDFRNITVSVVGALSSPIVNFLSIPIILRVYSPEEYGVWILAMSIVLIPASISTLKYEHAIVLETDTGNSGRIFGMCIQLAALTSLLAVLFVSQKNKIFEVMPALIEIESWLLIIPALILLISVHRSSLSLLTRYELFGVNASAMFALAIGTSLVQALSPQMGLAGARGLLLGTGAGYLISLLVIVIGLIGKIEGHFLRGLLSWGTRKLLVKYSNFPRYSVLYSLFSTLRLEGTKLIMGAHASASIVGGYSFAQRLTYFPVTFFSGGIRPVVFSKAVKAKSLKEIESFVTVVMLIIATLAIPPIVAFSYYAEAIIQMFVGDEWLGAASFAKILVIPAFFMLLTSWLDRVMDTMFRQKESLLLEVGFSAASLICLYVTYSMTGEWGAAVIAMSVVLAVYFITVGYVVFALAGLNTKLFSLTLGLSAVHACLTLFLAYFLNNIDRDLFASIWLVLGGWALGSALLLVVQKISRRWRHDRMPL
jgi:O-antigen/teichoic acid export membrane protein